MLRVDHSFLKAAEQASTADEIRPLLQGAIALEHATIPPYLTAMLSLKPGMNREIWDIIHSVVVDEMLHMSITCNVLNALGGAPAIDVAGFVPNYPSALPMSINGGLVVGLSPFSRDVARDVFMEIEEPETPLAFPVAPDSMVGGPHFATIGQFYAALIEKIEGLGDAAFKGNSDRQVVDKRWFPGSRLFAITDAATAMRALSLIAEEGEGTPDSPVDPDGDLAHYYRFAEIYHGRRLVAAPDVEAGYAYRGDAVQFDPAGVHDLTLNQKAEDLDPLTEGAEGAAAFNATYSKLLRGLHRAFNGAPSDLDAAMGVMFELKLVGQRLCALPAVAPGGRSTGRNVGPPFQRVSLD